MRRFVPRAMLAALVAVSATACAAGGGAAGVDPNTDFGDRVLVMVPDLEGPRGAQVATELRRLLTASTTHAAMNAEAIQAGMTRYQVAELGEITARQLAPLIRANLVSWGTVTQGGPGFQADIKFIDPRTGDEIEADASGATPAEVAAGIMARFTTAQSAMAQVSACTDALRASNWQGAVTACDAVLAVIPTSIPALHGRGQALAELDRHQDALASFNRILAIDATNADALIGAAKASSELRQTQQAVAFYNRYIDVNAATVENRMAVANTAVQAGDFASAVGLLESAAAENRTNVEFQRFLFNVAAAAGSADSTQATRYFTTALNAYQLAYPAGAEVDPAAVQNAVAVALGLNRDSDAVQIAQNATQRLPNDARIWSVYANALREAGRGPEALQAINRVIQIDPNFQGAYITRAQAYLDAGMRTEAMADFDRAGQTSPAMAQSVAQVTFNMGGAAMTAQNFEQAIETMTLAHRYGSGATKDQAAFYLGYAKLFRASALAQANTAQRAAVARPIVTMLEEALVLMGETTLAQKEQLIGSINTLLANQRAIVNQGR